MKITFVGSSHGVPEAHRKCSCIMIEIGENVYFVDMGTPAIDALRIRNIPVDAVKGIFITHMHGDHTNGLLSFIDLSTWYFKTVDPQICLPDISAVDAINGWIKVTMSDPKDFCYTETKPGVVFDDGVLKMTAIPTQHCPNSFAYLAEAEGKTVLFTGDLKNPAIDFPATEAGTVLDLVVCESAHFESTDYLPVFDGLEIRKVCVTHYSDRFLASVLTLCNTLQEKGVAALRATDDLEILV